MVGCSNISKASNRFKEIQENGQTPFITNGYIHINKANGFQFFERSESYSKNKLLLN